MPIQNDAMEAQQNANGTTTKKNEKHNILFHLKYEN